MVHHDDNDDKARIKTVALMMITTHVICWIRVRVRVYVCIRMHVRVCNTKMYVTTARLYYLAV